MQRDLSDYRKTYEKGDLSEKSVSSDPMNLFRSWFQEIELAAPDQENNAMSVSSIGLDGFPKTRVVLLKKFDSNGFVFYTNYNSEKGRSLANDDRICASFFLACFRASGYYKRESCKNCRRFLGFLFRF
jgi:pyridoxamine 5'-phosphate oxidase